jgi:hypothetical protein
MLPNSAMAATDPFKFFPGARMSSEVDDAVAAALDARGYQKSNTLFAHSVCSDEVNFAEKELIDLMRKRWGESFTLGGLAGVPFAGKAGLSAYAHHVPDEGKLFILFAPHVGVGYDGKVGAIERAGVVSGSSACGAAVGAYKTLSKPGAAPPSDFGDMNDLQFDYIKMKLNPKLSGVKAAPNDMAFVTYQMYSMVKEAMLGQIAASPGIWDDCSELAVLGGVQINRCNAIGEPIPGGGGLAVLGGVQINRYGQTGAAAIPRGGNGDGWSADQEVRSYRRAAYTKGSWRCWAGCRSIGTIQSGSQYRGA